MELILRNRGLMLRPLLRNAINSTRNDLSNLKDSPRVLAPNNLIRGIFEFSFSWNFRRLNGFGSDFDHFHADFGLAVKQAYRQVS